MFILFKGIYWFREIPIKMLVTFFTDPAKNTSQKTLNSSLEQKEQSWQYHNTEFKVYYTSRVTKTAWYGQKNRPQTRKPRNNCGSAVTWVFNNVSKIYFGERIVSSANGTGKTGYQYVWDWNSSPYSVEKLKTSQAP